MRQTHLMPPESLSWANRRCKNHPGVYLPSEKETRDISEQKNVEQHRCKWDDEQKKSTYFCSQQSQKKDKANKL